jgi:hypothetical protein
LRAHVFVDIDIQSAHSVHFTYGAVQELVVSGAIWAV